MKNYFLWAVGLLLKYFPGFTFQIFPLPPWSETTHDKSGEHQ